MKSYAQVARAYADITGALAQALTIYGMLTFEQRQTIDMLFRQQSTRAAATHPLGR